MTQDQILRAGEYDPPLCPDVPLEIQFSRECFIDKFVYKSAYKDTRFDEALQRDLDEGKLDNPKPRRYRKRRIRPANLQIPDTCKWCSRCGVVKDKCDFGRCRATKDGQQVWCRCCQTHGRKTDP